MREPRASRSGCASSTPSSERQPLLPLAAGAGEPRAGRLRASSPVPAFTGAARRRAGARRAARDRSTGVLLPRLGAEGQVTRRSSRPAGGRAELFDDANDAARRDHRATARCRPAASTASGRRTPRATTSSCSTSGAARSRCCASRRRSRRPRPNRCLADYVAPAATAATTSARSRSRSTAPTSWPPRYEAEHDDYRAIMVKALADRLAEAFAEYAPPARRAADVVRAGRRARRSRSCTPSGIRGIRPAFGYPACPDHPRSGQLFDLLGAERPASRLTEIVRDDPGGGRQRPATSRTRQARYFAVGRIGRDQVEDYAARKGIAGRRGRALAPAEPRLRHRRVTTDPWARPRLRRWPAASPSS